MKTILRLAISSIICFDIANAQTTLIVNDSSFTPHQLVNSILKGSCATIFNVSYAGNPVSIGYFSNGSSSIGIDHGVLLTTGSVDVAVGPNNAPDATFVTARPGDADLEASAGVINTQDACVLEFDFVTAGNSINLKYTFASEEYPEYVCSQFNDVFAFMITGTGFTPNTNIALIPGTALPVAINSINNGIAGSGFSNCISLSYTYLYNDNTGGIALQYDGFTDPLIATANVVPNDTYHVKLAIADVGDQYLDSGIFIEASNFNSGAVSVCPGDSFFAGGAWRYSSGIFYDSLSSAGGCDSIVATVLTIIGNLNTQTAETICNGSSYVFGNAILTSPGVYVDTFISREGCDSIVTLDLSVVSSFIINMDEAICAGDSIYVGSEWQILSGLYYDTFATSSGCDSIVITNLSVIDSFIVLIDTTINFGDSIFVQGGWQSDSGIYFDTLISSNGCDSIVVTQLSMVTFTTPLPTKLNSLNIYPNPFLGSTAIEYTLQNDSKVSLKVFDVLGKVVMEESFSIQNSGKHFVLFENSDSVKGLFIVELSVDGMKMRKRVVQIN